MSAEENKALVQRMIEAVNNRDLTAVDELYAPDFVYYLNSPTLPGGVIHGREGFKQFGTAILTAFPDYHITVEEMIAEGDKVVCRVTLSGTHQGDVADMPATGKRATWPAVMILRLAGGQVRESWALSDSFSLRQQLGLLATGKQS